MKLQNDVRHANSELRHVRKINAFTVLIVVPFYQNWPKETVIKLVRACHYI